MKYTVDSSEVYTRSEAAIIESMRKDGFRITDFRLPLKDERYVGSTSGDYSLVAMTKGEPGQPRYILEPLPKRKRVIFEETGEVRIPKRSEWYHSVATVANAYYQSSGGLEGAYSIYTRREEEF